MPMPLLSTTTVATPLIITKGEAILLITARDAARYLSSIVFHIQPWRTTYLTRLLLLPPVAGTVVLLYDHLLLFDHERRLIWGAQWTRWKTVFLLNRYIVPICLIALAYQLSTISSETYTITCKVMLTIVSLVSVISLGVVNFFVFHRIYAIWGYNKRLLQFLIPPYVCVYATAVALSIHTILHDFLHLTSYLGPPFNECAFETRPIQLVVVWSLLVILDVYLVVLAGWNILERPRETNTVIVRQLFNDGLGYFAISLTLRIFNIIVIAKLNLAYATLSVVASWSLITATVNRVILIGTDIVWRASQQNSTYQLDFIDTPFTAINPIKSATNSDENSFTAALGNGPRIVINSQTVKHTD